MMKLCIIHNVANSVQPGELGGPWRCTMKLVEPMMYPNAVKKSAMARKVMTLLDPVLMSFHLLAMGVYNEKGIINITSYPYCS